MDEQHRRPGDPYDVGFHKPPKRTQFKKGRSGNPNGRPAKKPDLYGELTRALRKTVTITEGGQKQRFTVQQALLMRLREQVLLGEVWAFRLLRKIMSTIPEGPTEYDHIERQVRLFEGKQLLLLMDENQEREKAHPTPGLTETNNVK